MKASQSTEGGRKRGGGEEWKKEKRRKKKEQKKKKLRGQTDSSISGIRCQLHSRSHCISIGLLCSGSNQTALHLKPAEWEKWSQVTGLCVGGGGGGDMEGGGVGCCVLSA